MCCALLLGSALPLEASGPGTSAAPFLRLGFGARALALGEAYVASANDPSALYYNPAGIVRGSGGEKAWEVLFSHAMHVQEIGFSQFALVRRPYGLAVTYLTVPGLERRSGETAAPEGSFGASDLAIGFSGARHAGPFALGGTVRLIRQSIAEYSATAVAFDIGAMYPVPGRPMRLGASLMNVGTRLRFVDQSFPLPTTLRVAAEFGNTKSFPAGISAQIDLPRDSDPLYRLGLEYNGFGPFALRAGYLAAPRVQRAALVGGPLGGTPAGLTEFFGYFAGFGFRFGRGTLDYAFLPYGVLGNSQRLSLSMKF